MIKKIDRLLLSSFIGPFVMTFCIAMMVLVFQFLYKYIDDLVGKGLEMSVIAELTFYFSASVVPIALPIAILLTSIMIFGNLGEHYELAALKSAGISLLRIMLPLFIVASLLSVGAFLFSNHILPKANLRFSTLLYSVTKKRPALNIKPGVFYDGIQGYIIRIGDKEAGSRVIHDVIIHNHTESRGNVNLLTAERGEMYTTPDDKYMVLRLYNGMQYEEPKPAADKRDHHELMRTQFDEYEMFLDLSTFDFKEANEDMFKNNYRMLNYGQLRHTADSLNRTQQQRQQNRARDLHNYLNFLPDSTGKSRLHPDLLFYAATDSMPELLNTLPIAPNQQRTINDRAKGIAQNAKFALQNTEKENTGNIKRMVRYDIEAHNKITLSFACIVLFLIGAPLGAIIRKGGLGMPMVTGIFLFILFYVLSTLGRKLVEELALSPFQGMWLSTAILLPLGLFLTYKAMNDSALLNVDAYRNWWKRWIPNRPS